MRFSPNWTMLLVVIGFSTLALTNWCSTNFSSPASCGLGLLPASSTLSLMQPLWSLTASVVIILSPGYLTFPDRPPRPSS